GPPRHDATAHRCHADGRRAAPENASPRDAGRARAGRVNLILRTVLQRLGLGILTLLATSIIIFATVEPLPGDFAKAILGQSAAPEAVAAFERQIGLDRPAPLRYLDWIGGVVRGDFGISFANAGSLGGGQNRTVVSLIAPRLANTLFLAGLAAI